MVQKSVELKMLFPEIIERVLEQVKRKVNLILSPSLLLLFSFSSFLISQMRGQNILSIFLGIEMFNSPDFWTIL